jgi:hypothetical protein
MQPKKIAICQSNYIPWKGYFDMIKQSDVFVIYDEVQYTRSDWRNRNQIPSPQGLRWLTIPVAANLGNKIFEVHSHGNYWRRKHWDTLCHYYGKSSRFSDFSEVFKELYLGSTETNLSKINTQFIVTVCKLLGIETRLVQSRDIPCFKRGKTERLIEIIHYLEGTEYISGGKAKAYLNTERLKEEKISISWMQYDHFPEYNQLQTPFTHHVSILDLLFNKGRDAHAYLQPSPLCTLAS